MNFCYSLRGIMRFREDLPDDFIIIDNDLSLYKI